MDSSPSKPGVEPSLPPPRSPNTTTTKAGTKRPAAALLPAFEPLSSSPGLPRPAKRQARAGSVGSAAFKYPTPVPTSSTGILSSSPPRVAGQQPQQRGAVSGLSERAPLSAVPSIELNENGETMLMGRSSNSSHYQLSANRLISRVHVKARYIPAASSLEPSKVEILCNGWNGLKVHCQGRTWDLAKGDTFSSETESAEIMLDVQDARVFIRWPKRDRHESLANLSDSSWDDSPRAHPPPSVAGGLRSSPLRRSMRVTSPESPTPAGNLPASIAGDDDDNIQIYEDASGDEQELPRLPSGDNNNANSSFLTEINKSFSSELSEPLSDNEDHENDPNEENDPIVHSFGPFGANLSNRMASFTTGSPTKSSMRRPLASPSSIRRRLSRTGSNAAASATGALSQVLATVPEPSFSTRSSPSPSPSAALVTPDPSSATPSPFLDFDVPAISNHVINQLAYSRLSSTPLSAILSHLPAAVRRDDSLTSSLLRRIIEEQIPCVGTIPRQGKDAAGKPLESEYYYVPERDEDEFRRLAVTDGMRKPSLRNCRKQHKQYYWKRPKTP